MFTTPKKNVNRDRFIPNRSAMDMEVSNFNLCKENCNPSHLDTSPSKEEYKSNLAASLFPLGNEPNGKILSFSQKAPQSKEFLKNDMRVIYSQNNQERKKSVKSVRHIPQQPEKILDAPELLDDYYLNLLDWNSQNVLSIALGSSVYLWNASSGDIQELKGESDRHITSVSWIQNGNYLAVGNDLGCVQIWDASKNKQIRNMTGHQARVGALSWNKFICSSGSRDSNIIHHDVRQSKNVIKTLSGHQQEVCGLKWSPDGTQLASGGNDNLLNIWNEMDENPAFQRNEHQAAVKGTVPKKKKKFNSKLLFEAIAWCPWQPRLLATGGGSSDRKIRFWNTQTGACLNSIETHSQVCAIQWSKHHRELVSSHGFSQNQLIVWKYPSMTKLTELKGHTSRVLHLAQSPDGCTIVSAAGDETLRFWRIFDQASKSDKGVTSSSSSLIRNDFIR